MRILRYHWRKSPELIEIHPGRLAAFALFPLGLLIISGIGYRAASPPVSTSSLIPAFVQEHTEVRESSAEYILEHEITPGLSPAYDPKPAKTEGFLKSGESLYLVLVREGIDQKTVMLIQDLLSPFFNFRQARPGDRFQVTAGAAGLTEFTYQSGPLNIFRVSRNGDSYLAEKVPVFPDLRITLISGELKNSLFETVTEQNELPQLALDFADLFSWDIDFSLDPRQGDTYRIVVEKLYLEGKFYQYGRILAAQYENSGETHTAIFFEDPDGKGDYFDREGKSVRRSFLKSPLKFSRISSGYTNRRFHPVLKRYRPHRGIDYAAPTGTPVWAIGDGVVISKGWLGQAGKAVRIRHPNGYISSYGHLNRFARGIRRGVKVKQKRVIGYVGATGLATGPHLDFRMKKNGKFVNPLRIKRPRERSVPTKYLDEFRAHRDRTLWAIKSSHPGTVFAGPDFSLPRLATSRISLR